MVSTSDQDPLLRIRAGLAAATIAEYLCARGKHVLLVVDSLTRLAMAQREIGLAAGEPPTAKGYTPSVFTLLARLIERAGSFGTGSITGFYTVLMEGDDQNEPVADAVRGILDGHVVLDRRIGEAGRYPAVDVLRSLSRTVPAVNPLRDNVLISRARAILARSHRPGKRHWPPAPRGRARLVIVFFDAGALIAREPQHFIQPPRAR